MIAQVITILLHLVLCYYFTFVLEMDVRGLGLASSITNFFKLSFVFGYSICSNEINKAMFRPGREAF